MKEKWDNLNEREKILLALMLLISSIYLFYCLLIAPLHSLLLKRSQSLQEKTQTLLLMQQAQQQQGHLGRKQLSSNQLLTAIATELNTNALKTFSHHLQQSHQGEIQLHFKEVPYLIFSEWLWDFSHHYAINIKQLLVEETPTTGLVSINATLH